MKAVKFEFKRMLHERNLKISLIISMIVIIMDIFEFYMHIKFKNIHYYYNHTYYQAYLQITLMEHSLKFKFYCFH